MTVQYTLDVSQTTTRSILKLLFRWRGSVWNAILPQLALWLIMYLAISCIYRYILSDYQQDVFASLVRYLDSDLSKYIPLSIVSFSLGFFVAEVVRRWQHIIDGIGWIDTSAVNFANFIRGHDENTRILRRTLIRYMVLNQALVLRDISMQARRRYPTLETLIASGLITHDELKEIHKIQDPYTRYWYPIHWCIALLYEAKENGKIASDHILEMMVHEIQHFRNGLAKLLKFDWIPLPLIYPQTVFLSVRLYFFICLISRQHIVHDRRGENANMIDIWIPIKTIAEFFVYIVLIFSALLNPLGEDADDVEANYVLDKNLIMGLTLVDQGSKPAPPLVVDKYYNNDQFSPLYSLDAAKRTVYPLVGSASQVNLVKNRSTITMLPHKSKLGLMSEEQQEANIFEVSVDEHNRNHAAETEVRKLADPDATLAKIRKRTKNKRKPNHGVHNIPITNDDRYQHPPPSSLNQQYGRSSYADGNYRHEYPDEYVDRNRNGHSRRY
ncbi:Bestrophin domain containing protein [Aphelenchoides besseyi]|nr:Bestrophin domain containing protein [Aphelenchoides besseyi]KAI6200729.1 Bestrophin domain containing protein [Aphelenchoides besseyi]